MKFVFSLVLMLFAGSLSASYMSECEALIGEWKECGGDEGNCTKYEKEIDAQCKCHVKKGGSWKLVHANIMGAGESNVCGFVPEDITPPPPEDPPGRNIEHHPADPGKGGDKGGDKGGK